MSERDASSPWDKRLRAVTRRSISQNQSLGARYFRLEPISTLYGRPGDEPLDDALDVLEELANSGRCVVVLPDESRLALYYVDAEVGRSRLVWYEPRRLLPPPVAARRWDARLQLAPEVEIEGRATRSARSRRY